MLKAQVILVISFAILSEKISGANGLETIDFKMVQQLAKKIGEELSSYGELVTKRTQLQESFSQARVINKNGTKLVEDITRDIKALIDSRVTALRKIVKVAEDLPKVYENTTDFTNYKFINTRKRDLWREEFLEEKRKKNELLEQLSSMQNYTKKRRPPDNQICYKSDDDSGGGYAGYDGPRKGCYVKFNETINAKSKEASVFLPLDIFDKDANLTRIIHRSRGLDKAFNHNYRNDQSIGWQYFCNATGLFRHFPATEWSFHPINTYDCRTRHWYTGAASSTKDVMILIERAGSIKGERLVIAKDVVRNILETLTPNDFVNVIQFNTTAEYILECGQGLIQATSANILNLKAALDNIEPRGQSNLPLALKMSFDILNEHRKTSANCNQVIFLITDGMEYNQTVQDIFREYNWEKGNNFRVFSYLIGEQIPLGDYEQVQLMACDNRGYYTQIDTITETREQALKYLQVMSRPLTYTAVNSNPISWANLYADIMEPHRVTNHDWNCRQKEMQRERTKQYLSEYDWYPCINATIIEKWNVEYRKYVFMTTVSMPAFERVTGMNASLMGVAAIDVPLYEFERLFQSYRLGVGGYAFVIDQNGNILTHPDFRPLFQNGILKPAYNAIDMAEVELMDDGYDARDFSSFLLAFRESIIDKPSGSKFMYALQPYDDMRRAIQLKRNYFWKKINSTPFTVVITFPEHATGAIQIADDVESTISKGKNLLKYFKDDFRLHPDWIYCRAIRKSFEELKLGLIDPDNCEMSPEEELVYYLEKFESSGAKWKQDKLDSNDTRCDRKLMNLLLFDARITENYPSNFTKRPKDKFDFDVKTSFISTHSGLFRFKVFDKKIRGEKFADLMKKSIDEVWYKHAVEFNRFEPDAFVYSVAFNAYEMSQPKLTITRTIHLRGNGEKVPAAVVGYQIPHSKFEEFIELHCPSDKEENCYVLDNNAYIVFDPDGGQHVGKFFGSIEKKLMHILVEDKIFTPIRVYDYQAVCYGDKGIEYEDLMAPANSALRSILWNPIKVLFTILLNFMSNVSSMPSYLANLMYPDIEHFYDDEINREYFCPNIHDKKFMQCLEEKEVTSNDTTNKYYKYCLEKKEVDYEKCMAENGTKFILERHITKTMPEKCDKFNVVYTLTRDESNFANKPYNECNRPFVVHKIAYSNLVLLKTNRYCGQVLAVDTDFNDVPKTIEYEDSLFCYKQSKPQLFRTRPKTCVTKHENEPKYDPNKKDRSQCGRGNTLQVHRLYIAFTSILLIFFTQSKFQLLDVVF